MGVAEQGRARTAWIGLLGLVALVLLGGRPVHAGPPEPEPEAQPRTEPEPEARAGAELPYAPEIDDEHLRLIWRPASVAWPLIPVGTGPNSYEQLSVQLTQREAMLAGELPAPSVRGVVEIGPEQAAGVWIAALETVRVRQLDGEAPLRFVRGVDGHAAVAEPGRVVAPGPDGERRWELHQPPSRGAVWSIEADEPTRILIERVEPRSPRYVAVEVEFELLEWIASGRPDADMAALLEPAGDLPAHLLLHAALARELVALAGDDRRLTTATEAWRMLAAMTALDRDRPPVRPYFVRDRNRAGPLELDGTEAARLAVDDSRDYRLATRPRRWTLARKGPGQLRIAARSWAPAGRELAPAELRVHAGGRVIARLPLSDRRALHGDRETALPQLEPLLTEDGEPVGEFARQTLVLPPGRHDYELELIGGPALLSIEATRRVEATAASLRGWTPRKRALAVERALRRDPGPAADWLALLLADQTHAPAELGFDDPRFDQLAERSPLLALTGLAIAAGDPTLDDELFAAQIARLKPWLARLDRDGLIDPAARGLVRARWLELVALHELPELADDLVEETPGAGNDPIAELPIAGLRLLADLFGPTRTTVRSPALAVLELARGRAPADEGLREQFLRLWIEASRWSRRRPIPLANETSEGAPFGPAGEWLVPRETEALDPIRRRNTWLRLEPGVPVRVEAELGSDAPPDALGRRMRLIDLHVATPFGDPDPVLLRVDDRRWWSPLLFGVQRHRVAVAPGVHELTLDGPAGTTAWVELPPAAKQPTLDDYAPESLGRRETMWPLDTSAWRLPGPAVPGFVRLELRWLEGTPPRPIRIVVHERGEADHADEGPTRTVLFDPRTPSSAADESLDPSIAIDREALPIFGSDWATIRHDLVLPIAATTKELRFEVEDEALIAASLSLRRGPRPIDTRGLVDAEAPVPAPVEELDGVLAGLAALDHDALLAELRALSQTLLDDPDDLDARARRAGLLLMIGETGHARADLLRLSAWAEETEREDRPRAQRERAEALLIELEERFDALVEPREIIVTDPERTEKPELIEPAIAAVVGPDRVAIDPWLETWAELRTAPYDEAQARLELELAELRRLRREDPSTPNIDARLLLGELARAHLLGAQPTLAREAGRAWLALYGRSRGALGRIREPIAVGLAAVRPLLVHLDDPLSDARDAGLAFGLARELEPAYGHTSVRRLAFIAALRSDWSRLDHSEDNAGFERLELPVAELEPSPSAEVREALLVAPWPASEAEQLRPGRAGVLAWDASPGTVSAEIWCRAARPDLAPGRADLADEPRAIGTAKLRLRLRSKGRGGVSIERSIELHDAELGVVDLPIDRSARHRLDVVLSDDPIWLCSWRTRVAGPTPKPEGRSKRESDKQVIEAHRRAQWWTAGSNHAVELVVLGPASLSVEARAIANPDPQHQPEALIATVERLDFDDSLAPEISREDAGRLPLAAEVERAVITESRRRFEVTDAVAHTILLTEPVPHRIRLRTDRGRALIRARLRRDRGDVPPPARVSIRELDPREPEEVAEGFDWRSVGGVQPILARDRVLPVRNRIGTLEARVRAGLDDLADVDDFRPRPGLVASVGWRRELVENLLWVQIAAEVRFRDRTAPAGGGSLGVGARIPVLGLRTGADLAVLAQSFAGRGETSVRLYAFVDRPTWLGPYLQLRPGLTVGLRWQSLDPARIASAPTRLEPHPRVYLRYIEDHPVVLQPELELRAYPFQDMALWTEAQVIPNSDIRSLDHVNIEIGAEGILRRPRPWVPLWGLSYQASPRFADEDRSAFFVRHRVDADLGVAVWARDTARIAFGLTNQLFLSKVAPIRDVIELWIRVDATFGRRMRDYGPREQWFREPWAPRAWGDDEHQARSTQAPWRR